MERAFNCTWSCVNLLLQHLGMRLHIALIWDVPIILGVSLQYMEVLSVMMSHCVSLLTETSP